MHKEAARQLFLDGFGSFLFDMKKAVFSPMPFYVGIYKFSKVKSAPYFMKDLDIFHFGENIFHRNDVQGKVEAHRALVKLNFEYCNNFDRDEEVYQNSCNMISLKKSFRSKITISGGKSSSRRTSEQKKHEEEVVQREKEEATQRLVEGARKLLDEEAQREKEEEEKRQK